MDQMGTSKSLCKPSNQNRKITWPEAPAIKQQFSLPDSIIYYITKNPSSSKRYLKMIQSCKYFFGKNPMIVADRIDNDGKKLCSKNINKCNGKCCVKIDITKLSSKIWLTHAFHFSSMNISNFVSTIFAKLSQYHKIGLEINFETIKIADFQLLAAIYDAFCFLGVEFVDNDGNDVMLENILELIPNVKEFHYQFVSTIPAATASTFKKISKLKNLGNLRIFHLFNFPVDINVEDIATFVKNHPNTKFWLHFYYERTLSEEYKKQLDAFVDSVIASDNHNFFIQYRGHDLTKHEIMENRYLQ